jgi:hypothetical protein
MANSITTPASPLQKVIELALKEQGCNMAELADLVGMEKTNFSLAKNSKRSLPLGALLNVFRLAGIACAEQVSILEWVAFEQKLTQASRAKSREVN